MSSERRKLFMVILSSWKDFFLSVMFKPLPWKEISRQFQIVTSTGWPVILIGGIIQAFFMMWNVGTYGEKFGANIWIGSTTTYAIFREMAVLITCILFASRIGTAFTVEIGSMQISEQIDALKLMNIDPLSYLLVPRVIASLIVLPLLTVLSIASAIFSSWIMMAIFWDISFEIFFEDAFRGMKADMLTNAMVRSFLMGFVVSLNAISLGLFPCNGAEDLGKVATRSGVLNIYCVIIIDVLLGILYSISYKGSLL